MMVNFGLEIMQRMPHLLLGIRGLALVSGILLGGWLLNGLDGVHRSDVPTDMDTQDSVPDEAKRLIILDHGLQKPLDGKVSPLIKAYHE